MPARLSPKNLVARPDRVDFRDRPYAPPLRSLPPVWPPKNIIDRNLKSYADYILDQGSEGACTGFGLAAVINFIFWSTWTERKRASKIDSDIPANEMRPRQVSPYMLYHNARLYDEWEGADYEGSSCRGAMKGWHKHGVCDTSIWKPKAKKQTDEWRTDAAARPLGAYYRIDAKSIADMQAAIFEVRSVYCSADVHNGWMNPGGKTTVDGIAISSIKFEKANVGGHAFAVVGYTSEGFIVQNSWGPDWGTHGFALLTYEDWIKNGFDAWVAALGAPMEVISPSTAGRTGLMNVGFGKASTAALPAKSSATAAVPWTEERAYRHAIVIGNDGKLIQRIVGAKDPQAAMNVVLQDEVATQMHKHLAIYVHGGLNDEQAAINRARRMGPWFTANGIHPIFVVWRTGFLESLNAIAADDIKKYEDQLKSIRSKGIGDAIDAAINALKEAKDRAFEVAAEKLIGKAVWSQMKQNAAMAAIGSGPLALMLKMLAVHKNMKFHLLGHSAGAIIIGHLLDVAARNATATRFASCGLYAPACTLDFAAEKYGKAVAKDGPLANGTLNIDVMTDQAELDDSVGPYGKSLLYLVSRATEDVHKMPLLGLDLAANPATPRKKPGMDLAQPYQKNAYVKWNAAVGKLVRVKVQAHTGPKIKTSTTQRENIAHGTFDNDIEIVNASLGRILGGPLKVKVTDLTGF